VVNVAGGADDDVFGGVHGAKWVRGGC
jgi:hypothetical protein